jgi:2-oxoglutarate/2-oxoacid ferredoxin oxidoreductase subunit beta
VTGGIGCSGRTPLIMDCNTMHTTHGRALAFATGVKLARPSLTVITVMGDGDSVAIGGNHFIHACRRNIDITAVIFNNAIYGLTGGQCSPTTPTGSRSTTSFDGNLETPFDICALALGTGAGFVARASVFEAEHAADTIQQGILYKGFAVVEVLTTCPTYYGRRNPPEDPYDMLHDIRVHTSESANGHVHSNGAAGADSHEHPMPVGIFRNVEREEYTERYRQLAAKARAPLSTGGAR